MCGQLAHCSRPSYLQAAVAIGVMLVVSCIVLYSEFLSILYFILTAIFCLGFISYAIMSHNGIERRRLIAFLLLTILAVCYWAIFYQQFLSISLCTARACMLSVPASSIPAVESLGIILAGPLINYVWFYFK